MRQTPHVATSLNTIFYKLLEIDFTPGTGLANQVTSPGGRQSNGNIVAISVGTINPGDAIYLNADGTVSRWPL